MTSSTDSDGDSGVGLALPDAFTLDLGLAATILMAIAAVLIAWTAFQSTKWSGVQAIHFSEAGAARTESTVFSTRAGQQAQVDIEGFTNWLNALQADVRAGDVVSPLSSAAYVPAADTLSGFLFERFREEFRPAVDAWLDTEPLTNPAAPGTPFEMPEYDLEASKIADLLAEADESARLARVANQNSDDYVINAVLAAMVIFFAGLSVQLIRPRNRVLALGLGVVLLFFTVYLVLRLPIEKDVLAF